MKTNSDKKSANQTLKNQKEVEYENENESYDEEEEEEEEVKINKNTKNTAQNKLPVKSTNNKITTNKKEEKPKISQTLYKPRLITSQNQDNNKVSLRRKLQEKRAVPAKESEQTPKKSEPVKTYENQIGQAQLDSHIHPPTSKNQNRYTKRQIDSTLNEENNEKEIKNIEDKNKEDILKKEDIKETKKEPRKETKKEPRKDIKKEPKIDDKEKKDKKENNTLYKEKETVKHKEKEKETKNNINVKKNTKEKEDKALNDKNERESENEENEDEISEEKRDYTDNAVKTENGIEIVQISVEERNRAKQKRKEYLKWKKSRFNARNKNRDYYYGNNRHRTFIFHKRGKDNFAKRLSNNYRENEHDNREDNLKEYEDKKDENDNYDAYDNNNNNYYNRYNRGRRRRFRNRPKFLVRGRPNPKFRGFRGRRY